MAVFSCRGEARMSGNDRRTLERRGQGAYRTGPDLRVGGELVGVVTDVEEQALEVIELLLGELQQAGVLVIRNTTSQVLVNGEGVFLRYYSQGCIEKGR